MTAPSSDVVASKTKGRSRVSNGSATFLDDQVDGRSRTARRYRDVLGDLVAHMGGDPSAAETLIARRAAALAVWCEQAESDMAGGQDLDVAAYTTSTNALRRLLQDLGLERRARDVTPTLDKYLANRSAP